jgi:hypothetical protein
MHDRHHELMGSTDQLQVAKNTINHSNTNSFCVLKILMHN